MPAIDEQYAYICTYAENGTARQVMLDSITRAMGFFQAALPRTINVGLALVRNELLACSLANAGRSVSVGASNGPQHVAIELASLALEHKMLQRCHRGAQASSSA